MKLSNEDILTYFNKIIEKGVISKDDIKFDKDNEFNFNSSLIINALNAASELFVIDNDDSLYYTLNGSKIKCPEVDDGIEDAVIFLSDRIPEFTFYTSDDNSDIENDEIEAMYCCMMVASILKNEFKEELVEAINEYDINKIEARNIEFKLFTEILNSWLQLQSKLIQAIVSAARECIASKKEQYSSLDLSKLKKEERLKLNVLKDKIRIYFNEFKREKLTDYKIKNLKKHEIYKLYDERDSHIREKIILSAEYTSVITFYMIDKLNYEDISPLIKKRLYDSAISVVKESYTINEMSKEYYLKIVNKFNRKGIKVFLRKWKNDELDKYLQDRVAYKLPKKL